MLQVLLMCLNVAEDSTLPTYMQKKKISLDLYLNLNSDILLLTTEDHKQAKCFQMYMSFRFMSGALLVERQYKVKDISRQMKTLLQVYDLASTYWKMKKNGRDIFDPSLSPGVTAIAAQVKMIVNPFIEFYGRSTDTKQQLLVFHHIYSVAKSLLVRGIFQSSFHARQVMRVISCRTSKQPVFEELCLCRMTLLRITGHILTKRQGQQYVWPSYSH